MYIDFFQNRAASFVLDKYKGSAVELTGKGFNTFIC